MKKFLKFFMIMFVLLFVSTGIYAAVDTTEVTTVTTYSLKFLFGAFGSYISAHAWSTVFTIAFILSEVLANVKWTPHNSILQIILAIFKAVVNFFAGKKTAEDTTDKASPDTTAKQ